MKTTYLSSALAIAILALTGCTTAQTAKQSAEAVHADSHANHHEHGQDAHGHDEHHDHAHWGYAKGGITPDHWGDIEVNKLCGSGTAQSPINIREATKSKTTTFNLNGSYQAQDFTVKNNGHTIVFNAKDPSQSKLDINGTTYELLQFHYHVPSEHTVMNAFYPLELHFVHKNADNGLAVVGVLVDKGEQNDELAKILTDLPVDDKKDGELVSFNAETLMPKNSPTYAYEGSLTTPPCSEQVQWLLKANPIHASTEQLKVLSALYDGNNRPVQSQGERKVYYVE